MIAWNYTIFNVFIYVIVIIDTIVFHKIGGRVEEKHLCMGQRNE